MISKIEAELSKQQKKVNLTVLIFTLLAIWIDYLYNTVLFFELNKPGHSLDISAVGSSIILTVILMTNSFKKLLKQHGSDSCDS
ncbi:hypothetical protein JK628_16335 [Shewanella sp. KX20019]|uniref:hypothetical protein n=1 Tax=Shewanella sp. KX20019 TaxID=2803864 RepID=UPI001927E75B|nr:hypothetical protein [Shewanella sp. KX20019]QQX79114.1 hypothetical protein JK628_16335 [Shewanella sp. KX20019]